MPYIIHVQCETSTVIQGRVCGVLDLASFHGLHNENTMMYFFCNVTTVVPHIPKERIYCLRNHNNIECGVIKATSRLTFLNFLETLFFANNVANVAHIGKFKYNTKNNCNIKCIIYWSVYQITHEKKITKKFSKISRPFTFKILGEGGINK